MTKFSPKFIGVTENPILIVGEKPGNTRDGSTFALQGNRTGDFVDEALNGMQNVILTNVVNLQYNGIFKRTIGLADGLIELIEIIENYQPRKIISLGSIALVYVNSLKFDPKIPHFNMPHPSWINRFQASLRPAYIKKLRDELNN